MRVPPPKVPLPRIGTGKVNDDGVEEVPTGYDDGLPPSPTCQGKHPPFLSPSLQETPAR